MDDAERARARRQSIRFPRELAEEIGDRAVREDRTFTGQVPHLLRGSLNAPGGIDPEEIERLAEVARQTIAEHRR
ncbi:MAG: hypothetical protein ABI990_03425 [Actinomycetota bacterium]